MSTNLRKLKKIIATGSWSWHYKEAKLIDPEGNSHVITFTGLSPASEKLYGDYICSLLNDIDSIIEDLDRRTEQVSGLFRELNHHGARIEQSYIDGIEDAAEAVSSIEAVSPTSRDALNEAISRLDTLRKVRNGKVTTRDGTEGIQGTERL